MYIRCKYHPTELRKGRMHFPTSELLPNIKESGPFHQYDNYQDSFKKKKTKTKPKQNLKQTPPKHPSPKKPHKKTRWQKQPTKQKNNKTTQINQKTKLVEKVILWYKGVGNW